MAVDKNNLEQEACVLQFYKTVLGWDYRRLCKEFMDREKNNKKNGDGSSEKLKKVKNTYIDVDEYLATFEPLLFEEVKAQIMQQKDDEEETEWQQAMVAECSEVNEFHLPAVICDVESKLSQNDLLLLSTKKDKQSPTIYAFALIEDCQIDHPQDYQLTEGCQQYRMKMRLRLYLKEDAKNMSTDDAHTYSRRNMVPIVNEVRKCFYFMKFCSLSTIIREYIAMRSVSSLPFKDLILNAKDTNDGSNDRTWKLSRPLKEFIEGNHNKSQLEAINAGLSRKSFVLIQGPPGTGKTQTILGILSAILHATPARVHSNKSTLTGVKRRTDMPLEEKFNNWLKASPWLLGANPRDEIMPIDGDDGFFPTSSNELKPEVVNSSRKYRVRVLVCAPSNSALDEIVIRLLNTGVRDENNHAYNPKIVRIGLNPHHSVQAVSMDYLVNLKRASTETQTADKHKRGVAKDLDSIRASILDEAVIVFSTLSFSGSALFSKLNRGFDVVIIDEAAQAIEPATLIPLANGCKQVFLVGDPVQLPATVISPVAGKVGYGMSLFTRFQRAGYPVQMLKTQYRMNPEIRSFPSKEFYDEALEDGPDVEEQTRRSWHQYRCFGPFCFFDIHEGNESQPSGSGSWVNTDEVDFVLAMYSKLVSNYPELKASSRLAIITPYRYQMKLFKERFRATFGVESKKVVDINTVDGFQGREKDVAIFSCVRSSKTGSIGFLADYRRMNVGITRARSSILVVGSALTLKRGDKHWKDLVESAEQRNMLFKVSKPYTDFFSDTNLKSMIVKEFTLDKPEPMAEEMDAPFPVLDHANTGTTDPGQAEEPDWGDGGGDEAYDGDFGED